tara:strand:+ start:732 stop:2804 length:2073 start_codon:yes stop_codon:yes gene_type:complete
MPTFPVPMAFWTFLMIDSKYKEMIVKESAGRIANDNIAETREQIFSKFANLDTGNVFYDDLDSFFGLFSSNFPKEYEKLVADVPRNERKQAKEKILERFSKVLEFNTTRDKGGRPKLDFGGQMTKFANAETVNTKTLDAFYKVLMEKYETYGGNKESNINRLRKDMGRGNRNKILSILKQNVNDSKATLTDFDEGKNIMFNVMKITFAIGNFGIALPEEVAGFTKNEEMNEQIRGLKTTQKNSYTVYEKIVQIDGFISKDAREEWVKGMDKYIDLDFEKREGQLEEVKTVKFKEDNDYELSIIYIEDRPLLREILSKKDIIIIDDINIDVGLEVKYTVPTITNLTIKAYLDTMASSSRTEQTNKDKHLAFKLGNQSLQKQRKILYLPQKTSKSKSKRLYFHPILQNLLTTEGNNVFEEAVEGITQKTAKAFEQRQSKLDEATGLKHFDRRLIDDEIFEEGNVFNNDELYKDYINGDDITHISQVEDATDVEKLQAGLVAEGDKYITTNRDLITFITTMEKFALDERGQFDDDLVEKNQDIILGEVSDKIAFTKPAEIAFVDYLLAQKKTSDITTNLVSRDLSNYYKSKMFESDGFAFLFSIANLFGQDLRADLEKLIKGKKVFTKKDLSIEHKSLITKIVAQVEQDLRKIRTQFKEGLKEKLESIAKNPKRTPKPLIKKLVKNKLLEIEE